MRNLCEAIMGKIVSSVTDAVGLTDSKAGERAAAASQAAAGTQAQYQQEALDYLKQQEALPTEIRNQALQQLQGLYMGDQPLYDQQQLIQQAQASPLYGAIMGGQQAGEEAILRQAGATGGLRSGDPQAALADYNTQLQNQALLESYNQQLGMQQQQLGGIQSLAQLPSGAGQIAGLTSGIGQTLAQGQTAAAQAQLAGSQQNVGNLLGLGQLGIGVAGLFSDIRLKENIEYQGRENGYPVYTWDWNETAKKLGMTGSGYGVIADELEKINPDAVGERDGYKTVNYEMIGVNYVL